MVVQKIMIENEGAVLSTAINAFVYVIIKERFKNGIRLSYSITENVRILQDLQVVLLIRNLRLLTFTVPYEIVSNTLYHRQCSIHGSSSSFSVGL